MPELRATLATCVLLLLSLIAGRANAGDGITLRGTVGTQQVVMELAVMGDEVDGHYFYARHLQDIPLRGEQHGNDMRLHEDGYGLDDAGKANRFVLVRHDDGFDGRFIGVNGKTLPVHLIRVAPNSVADPAPGVVFEQRLSDYDRLRVGGLRFTPGKTQTFDGKYLIQWRTEPRSGFAMFQLVGGYPQAAMAAMNRVLDRDFLSGLLQYFSCADGAGGNGMDTITVSEPFLDDRYVSYTILSSWSCYGAAHPDFETLGTTLDARSGKELTLEDILWLGKGSTPAPESDAWYAYRSDVFAPAVVKLLTRLHPDQMHSGVADDDCDYSDPDVWAMAPWALTREGLWLGAYFPRVNRSCDDPEWAVIPYDVLARENPARFAPPPATPGNLVPPTSPRRHD